MTGVVFIFYWQKFDIASEAFFFSLLHLPDSNYVTDLTASLHRDVPLRVYGNHSEYNYARINLGHTPSA